MSAPQRSYNMIRRSPSPGGRIDYVDLAKGVSMFLLIIQHMTDAHVPLLNAVQLPVFFFLSGVFYKDATVADTASKKWRALLVPFITFNILYEGYLWLETRYLSYDQPTIHWLDILTLHRVNGSMWFLLALFWDFLIVSFLHSVVKHPVVRIVTVAALATVGCLLDPAYNHWYVESALMALPFFYAGFMLKGQVKDLANRNGKMCAAAGVLLLGAALLYILYVEDAYTSLAAAAIINGNVAAYVLSFAAIGGLLLVCRGLRYLPVISCIGEFSLMVLCVHLFFVNFVCHIIQAKLAESPLAMPVGLMVVVALCLCAIPVCDKYLPFIFKNKKG